MANEPMLIAVAPNGARKTKQDHPELPLSSSELIKTAISCIEAGAGMMHFHVRDIQGKHSLDHTIYGPVLKELQREVGDKILLQVSSESAGRYQAEEQIEQMKRLAPHCISCGLREIIKDRDSVDVGHSFFSELHGAGALIQYILYNPEDVRWYETLCDEGILPGEKHLLLFVMGRYHQQTAEENYDLHPYVSALKRNSPWMACGFGRSEHGIMAQAVKLGGHARVGFENNQQLPDGSIAPDNAALVQLTSEIARLAGRLVADRVFAETLYES
ncbi:MAG: 3-keto-5-aminohexanoate cleavage protein [Desulfobulbaceae bacterium]|nr:3-keto-5-aminohexanoate cleavage protein [Desulfobulbaceae bacterium]